MYTNSSPGNCVTDGCAVSQPVTVLQPDGSPSLFFEGAGGSLWNFWYDGGAWGAAEIASNGVQSSPVAILQPNGSPSVFVVGPANSLLNYWYIPSQGTWGEGTVAGAGSAFDVPAAVGAPEYSTPEVFVQGPSHSLMSYDYIETSLATWSVFPVAGAGSSFSAPSLVVQPDTGTISLFVVGPSHTLLNYWFQPPVGDATAAWNSATVAQAGSTYSVPAVMLQPDGVPTVFVLGPNGSILNFWYMSAHGTWGSGTVEAPGTGDTQLVGVLGQTDGSPEVFYDADDILSSSSYSQGRWSNAVVNAVPGNNTLP